MHLPNVIIAVFITWLLSLPNDSTDATVTGISLEGCFRNLSYYTTRRNLSDKNGPRHCFDECNNTEYIGLQKQDCFCNVTRDAYATERDCGFSCPGDRSVSCGSDNAIYVYSKVQTNINVYGESGFVYIHVFKVPGDLHYTFLINGTSDITEKHHYICYDEPRKCDFKAVGVEMTWLDAMNACHVYNQGLVPYRIAIDETICKTLLPDGYFWIGMSWFEPASTTTISTTTVITTTQRTTRMRRTTTMASVASTTSTNIKSKSVTLYSTTLVKPTSSGDKTSTLIAISVIIPVLLIATVVSIVICFRTKQLCFKKSQNRVREEESIRTTPLEIPGVDPLIAITATTNVPPFSTMAHL